MLWACNAFVTKSTFSLYSFTLAGSLALLRIKFCMSCAMSVFLPKKDIAPSPVVSKPNKGSKSKTSSALPSFFLTATCPPFFVNVKSYLPNLSCNILIVLSLSSSLINSVVIVFKSLLSSFKSFTLFCSASALNSASSLSSWNFFISSAFFFSIAVCLFSSARSTAKLSPSSISLYISSVGIPNGLLVSVRLNIFSSSAASISSDKFCAVKASINSFDSSVNALTISLAWDTSGVSLSSDFDCIFSLKDSETESCSSSVRGSSLLLFISIFPKGVTKVSVVSSTTSTSSSFFFTGIVTPTSSANCSLVPLYPSPLTHSNLSSKAAWSEDKRAIKSSLEPL